ncbi:sulfite exporter TauE/SafE family protein [Vibrionales bacterium C3R12]|nr:sulfite exporter TauE/SafE family protein [Vibrionales bacterium C3R12]
MAPDWLAAFAIGLIGAGHCMGMCGGIASMLSISSNNSSHRFTIPIFYNIGRLLSYTLIGALIGGTVSSLTNLTDINHGLVWLRFLAAIFMILLAFYIGRWWHGLLVIEKLGQKLWKFISPAGKSLLPLKSSVHALPFGFIWGWLPCGLVYSTLTWSAVSGSAFDGAIIMLSFGLGTLPAMLLIGIGASYLKTIQQSPIFRNVGALMILAYGLYTAINTINILEFTV